MRSKVLRLLLASPLLIASSFQPPAPFLTTGQIGLPIWLGGADMNGDGSVDLVSIQSGTPLRIRGSNSITIGAFDPETGSRVVSETPFSGDIIDAAIGEFTGDVTPDVLFIDRGAFGPDRICVATGTGKASIGAVICTQLTDQADHAAAGDFNGDGKLDTAITHPLTGQVAIWYGKGDGTFTPGPTLPVPATGVLAAADFNADGIADVAVHSRSGKLFLLTSAQRLPLQSTLTFAASNTVSDIAAADINGDGKLDVILCDLLSGLFGVGLGTGPAAPYLQNLVTTDSTSAPRFVQIVDINGDKIPEILVSTSAGMMIARIGPDGSVVLPAAPGFSLASSTHFAIVDFNGDKNPDLITYTGALAQNVSVLLGQETATTTALEVSATSATFGQRIAITIRALPPSSPLPLIPASGKFTLYSGRQALQTVPALPGSTRELAVARFEIALPIGTHDLTAALSDAKGFTGSVSPAVRVTVQTSTSNLRLVSTSNEISRERGLPLSAAVSGPGGPAMEGTVKLSVNKTVVTQATVANGTAQLSIPAGLPLGKTMIGLSFEAPGYAPAATEELEFVVRGTMTAGNAASYRGPLAPDALAVVAVPGLGQANTSAAAVPWPLSLGRVSAQLRVTGGAPVNAGIVFAGLNQVNLYIPPLAPGPATLHILLDGVSVASSDVTIQRAAPGIFTVNAEGVPAALAALYSSSGQPTSLPVFTCAAEGCAATALRTGAEGETLVLTLFGTGWRNAAAVNVSIGGETVEVLFAGAHQDTPGLDQLNAVIPNSLAGRGRVELSLDADGTTANGVYLILE